MFIIKKQIAQPTVVTHCAKATLERNGAPRLIVAKNNIIETYSTENDMLYREQQFVFAGKITGLAVWKGEGKDRLVLSFEEAKLSVVEYSEDSCDIEPHTLHFYEKEEYKTPFPYGSYLLPQLRGDGSTFLYRVYEKHFAVLTPNTTGHLCSSVHPFSSVSERFNTVYDFVLLTGHSVPVAAVLFDSEATPDHSQMLERTKKIAFVEIDTEKREFANTVIVDQVPTAAMFLHSVDGMDGVLSFSDDSIDYVLFGSIQLTILLSKTLREPTSKTIDKTEENVSLIGSRVTRHEDGKHILVTGNGSVYVLGFVLNGRRLLTITLEKVLDGVSANSLCSIGPHLFAGSSAGESVLARIEHGSSRVVSQLPSWGQIGSMILCKPHQKTKHSESRLEMALTTKHAEKNNFYLIKNTIAPLTLAEMGQTADEVWAVDEGLALIRSDKKTFLLRTQKGKQGSVDKREMDGVTVGFVRLSLGTEKIFAQVCTDTVQFFDKKLVSIFQASLETDREIKEVSNTETHLSLLDTDKRLIVVQIEPREESLTMTECLKLEQVDACCLFWDRTEPAEGNRVAVVQGSKLTILSLDKKQIVFEDCLFGETPPLLVHNRPRLELEEQSADTHSITVLSTDKTVHILETKRDGRTTLYTKRRTLFQKNTSPELELLALAVSGTPRKTTFLENIFGLPCLFLTGDAPFLFLFPKTQAEPYVVPVCSAAICAVSYARRNTFYAVDSQKTLRLCFVEEQQIENGWLIRKTHLDGQTLHAAYNIVSSTITAATQTSAVSQLHLLETETLAVIDTHSFDPAERITDLKTITLNTNQTEKGKKPFVLCTTTVLDPDAISLKTAIYLFDIVDIVYDPLNPKKIFRLKQLHRERVKGAVTAMCGVAGFLVTAQTTKTIIYSLEEDGLTPSGFCDIAVCGLSVSSIKNYILYGDYVRGLFWLAFQEDPPRLRLLGKTDACFGSGLTEFAIDGACLSLVSFGCDCVVRTYLYAPESVLSAEGEKLLPQTAFRTSSPVSSVFRIASKQHDRHSVVYSTEDGSIEVLLPVDESLFRRLRLLALRNQSFFPGYCGMTHGRSFLNVEQAPHSEHDQGNSVLVADDLFPFAFLSAVHQKALADKIEMAREDLFGDLAALCEEFVFLLAK
ncbi:MAG: cleavage and polyadenylation specificity factor subunit 1 [Amphiamblys sp. WSBS2006]|nr:MAG: cleavage and polyadenylation specificity factor subunit 1 [Amphiamblys sp. WSBS2006]